MTNPPSSDKGESMKIPEYLIEPVKITHETPYRVYRIDGEGKILEGEFPSKSLAEFYVHTRTRVPTAGLKIKRRKFGGKW